jgi:hypothetical protein
MVQFKNLFLTIGRNTAMNFTLIANIRRRKLEQEGFNTSNINWEHYAKVLYAKQQLLQD